MVGELPSLLPVLVNNFIDSDCQRDNDSSVHGGVVDDNRVRVLEIKDAAAQEDVLPHVQLVNLRHDLALHVIDFEAEAKEVAFGFEEFIAVRVFCPYRRSENGQNLLLHPGDVAFTTILDVHGVSDRHKLPVNRRRDRAIVGFTEFRRVTDGEDPSIQVTDDRALFVLDGPAAPAPPSTLDDVVLTTAVKDRNPLERRSLLN